MNDPGRRPSRDRRREMELEAQRLLAEEQGLGRYLEHRANHRFAVWRTAAIYIPSAVVLTGLLVVALVNLPNSIIGLVVVGIFALPVDWEAMQAIRDLLRRQPVTSRGVIDRQWSKSRFLFFGRVRYVLVDARRVREDGSVDVSRKPKSTLFEVGEMAGYQLNPGDEVEVVHWPHTNVIVTLERLHRSLDDLASDRPSPPGAWDELDQPPPMNPWIGR